MRFTAPRDSHRPTTSPAPGRRAPGRLHVALLLAGLSACGPGQAPHEEPWRRQPLAQTADNGLTVNGLTVNGLTVNGLTVNGLTVNGLDTASFASWFASDPALNDMVMHYLVQCALEAGKSLTYTPRDGSAPRAWSGGLGLAPDWTGGASASAAERQVVSACLAAHVNKYGQHISLSLLGRDARRDPIPYTATELQTYERLEGCFFGDLFSNEGVFAGADRGYLQSTESSLRACALTHGPDSPPSGCAPLVHIGRCEAACTLDASGLYYTECTWGGRRYLPLTTRIRPADVYVCGDGVCQPTERCAPDSGQPCESCIDCAQGG